MIQVIKEMSEIKDINQLTSLIKKQLPYDSHHDSRKILRSLENAFSRKSSAVLFLCQSDQVTYQGFDLSEVTWVSKEVLDKK